MKLLFNKDITNSPQPNGYSCGTRVRLRKYICTNIAGTTSLGFHGLSIFSCHFCCLQIYRGSYMSGHFIHVQKTSWNQMNNFFILWALVSIKKINYCAMQKHVFGHMQTVKVKISQCMCAICSASMLTANIIIENYRMYQSGWPHIFSNQIPWFFPDLIWFSLIKNLNIIAMAPTFRSHILIQMLSEYTANKYST